MDEHSPKPDQPQPCSNCGYDLRGSEASACCPECGAAVHAALHVDGKFLVVPRGTSLPPRCVYTNQAVDGKPQKVRPQVFTSPKHGRIFYIALLVVMATSISLPALTYFVGSALGNNLLNYNPLNTLKAVIFSYLLAMVLNFSWLVFLFFSRPRFFRRCQLTYYESGIFKQPRRRAVTAFVLGILLTIVAIDVSWYMFEHEPGFEILALFLLLMLPSFWLGRRLKPLKVVKHENGLFWIAGCGKAFLKSIEAEQKQGIENKADNGSA